MACRSTSPRPTSTTSRPQKCFAADGGLWLAAFSPAALARVDEIAGIRPLGARLLQPAHGGDQQPAQPDLQHPGAGHPGPAAQQVDWINGQGGLDWAVARTEDSSGRLYDWAERTAYTTPYVDGPGARSQVVGHDRLRRRGRRRRHRQKTLRAHGVVDVEPYRKLGRNQLRVAMFPAVEPDDVSALIACVEHVVG